MDPAWLSAHGKRAKRKASSRRASWGLAALAALLGMTGAAWRIHSRSGESGLLTVGFDPGILPSDPVGPTAHGAIRNAPERSAHQVKLRVTGAIAPAPGAKRRSRLPFRPDSQALGVVVTTPQEGTRLHGLAPVLARLVGEGEITRVEFQVDGQWQGISNHPPFRFDWNTRGNRNGPTSLRVVAYDAAGHVHSSKVIHVTVAN